MTSDEARGKHGRCETVTVQVESGLVVINACDFDPTIHQMWTEGAPMMTPETILETSDEMPAHDVADAASPKAGKKKR